MIQKITRIFEYVYLAIAVFFSIEGVRNWSDNSSRAYLFFFFAAMAIFMFFFRRHFRRKMQDQKRQS